MSTTRTKPAGANGATGSGSGRLTLPVLERHLWGAADLLRGSIDSGDFNPSLTVAAT